MPSVNPSTAAGSSSHPMDNGVAMSASTGVAPGESPPRSSAASMGGSGMQGQHDHRGPPEGMDPRMMSGYHMGFSGMPGHYMMPVDGRVDPNKQYAHAGGQTFPAPATSGGHPYHAMQSSYGQAHPAGSSGYGNPTPMFAGSGAQPYGYAPQGRGHPNWYGYNPEHYPTQQATSAHPTAQSSRSTRGGRAHPTKLPYSPPRLREKTDGLEKMESRKEATEPTKKMDDLEAERVRNTEAAELSLSEVKPIQTDFHFFVATVRDKLRIEAEKEVSETNNGVLDPFLVNTNLNCRLKKVWEDLSREEREEYLQKEEEDRRRFTEEDEVASRHCFTLTARLRSQMKKADSEKGSSQDKGKEPADGEVNVKEEVNVAEGSQVDAAEAVVSQADAAPVDAPQVDAPPQAAASPQADVPQVEGSQGGVAQSEPLEKENKRSQEVEDDSEESPSKKNRVEGAEDS